MGGLVWFDKTVQACQGPTYFIAYERGWVMFEYSHVFRSGGSLMEGLFSAALCTYLLSQKALGAAVFKMLNLI
jgi:hypothetical protein